MKPKKRLLNRLDEFKEYHITSDYENRIALYKEVYNECMVLFKYDIVSQDKKVNNFLNEITKITFGIDIYTISEIERYLDENDVNGPIENPFSMDQMSRYKKYIDATY
jgi:hypothetical protein